MRKIIVFTNLTLDGVMQAPGRPDEDNRDGFKYGGWAAPYNAMVDAQVPVMSNIEPLLFGRRTYQDFYQVWPNRTDNPFTERLNNAQKYVASTTLKEPLPWMNSVLLKGDAMIALTALKQVDGKDFLVFGSGVLVQSLMQHKLVDFFVLMVHPLILGAGRHLFSNGTPYTTLKLLESQSTPTGVAVLTYAPV
jgi:dihydrofolate reductase